MPWQVMPNYRSYSDAKQQFQWDLPDKFNPAFDFLQKHENPAPSERTALIDAATDKKYTFEDIDRLSGLLAAALQEIGISRGDRVGVIAPQRVETPVAHTALWRLAAVTVPMTTMYGPDAVSYRLSDSAATGVIFDPTVEEEVIEAIANNGDIEFAIELDSHPWYVGDSAVPSEEHTVDCPIYYFDDLIAQHTQTVDPIETVPSAESTIMYTSGSTGPPKGALHSHGIWLGRAAASFNFFEGNFGAEEVNWTPADWAWGSALGGLLMGSWHHGTPVVAAPMKGFDSEAVFKLLEDYQITNALIPPTALRMLIDGNPGKYDLSLQTIASAGEPLTPEILAWSDENFDDLTINEYYGQTELNLVISNAERWYEVRPGSMGKPLPGYEVTILDPDTYEPLPPGEVGEIAVKPQDDTVFFKKYINRPEATADKQKNGWYLTSDHAYRDEDGYFWFEGRADDVIITSGYRVGPVEVEQVLLDHPQVEQVGVIGVPDETRGELIKAYVKLVTDATGNDDLRAELRALAKDKLAKHEYPREIEFVETLPMTSSGKIQRVKLRERET